MAEIILLFKMIACLAGSIAVGNWFLLKVRRGHARGEAWYKAYLTPPGLIILSALVVLPLIMWLTAN